MNLSLENERIGSFFVYRAREVFKNIKKEQLCCILRLKLEIGSVLWYVGRYLGGGCNENPKQRK